MHRRSFQLAFAIFVAFASWAGEAAAYRLPPEKMLQYWAARVGRYGAFEVRGTHTVFDEAGEPFAAPARFLFDRRGQFRFDRTPKETAPLAVVSTEEGVLAAQDGAALGPEVVARYDFARLFSLGRRVSEETLGVLQADGVMMDSPPVLWLLAELRRMGVVWKLTRLSPYGEGEVAYVMGRPYENSGESAPEGSGSIAFDNREFTPVELQRNVKGPAGSPLVYRTVLSGYRNDILQYFPRSVDLYIGDRLAERFVLESARLQPTIGPTDFDLSAARKALLSPESDEVRPEKSAEKSKPAAPPSQPPAQEPKP